MLEGEPTAGGGTGGGLLGRIPGRNPYRMTYEWMVPLVSESIDILTFETFDGKQEVTDREQPGSHSPTRR